MTSLLGAYGSHGKKYFTYGKITARIKMSNGYGSWLAFWMLGENDGEVGWPACGEIDILEHNNSDSFIYNTLHWNQNGSSAPLSADAHTDSGLSITSSTPEAAYLDVSEWHEYTCVWTSSSIKMYIDEVQVFEYAIDTTKTGMDAFHKPFYVIFNFAMGGDMPQVSDSSQFTKLPWQMYVDYVRLYQ